MSAARGDPTRSQAGRPTQAQGRASTTKARGRRGADLGLDPIEWTLPDPEQALQLLRRSGSQRDVWGLSDRLASVNLYSYLKYRFGEPNGPAMALRRHSADNLIHWDYLLACGPALVDVWGMDTQNRVVVIAPQGSVRPDWPRLERRLLEEFEKEARGMAVIRKTFERWQLFINPHQVLRSKLEAQSARLRELNIGALHMPNEPATAQDLEQFQNELGRCQEALREATSLAVDIRLSCPIFCESAVNLLMLALAKPELRRDTRLLEYQRRRNIDVRVKTLHLVCDGFSDRIDGTEKGFRDFLRLMNERNDLLHGNVDPVRGHTADVYFDYRFIPLFARPQNLAQLAYEGILGDIDPEAALRDWDVARVFVDLLLEKLEPPVRSYMELVFAQQQLGYRSDTKTVGVVLPPARLATFLEMGDSDRRPT